MKLVMNRWKNAVNNCESDMHANLVDSDNFPLHLDLNLSLTKTKQKRKMSQIDSQMDPQRANLGQLETNLGPT